MFAQKCTPLSHTGYGKELYGVLWELILKECLLRLENWDRLSWGSGDCAEIWMMRSTYLVKSFTCLWQSTYKSHVIGEGIHVLEELIGRWCWWAQRRNRDLQSGCI